MSKRWYQENRRDPWRREARSKGYRARSAYKLKQIQDKFGIIRKGDSVLDVGCHPGGWTQVAVEEAGENGFVLGIPNLGINTSVPQYTKIHQHTPKYTNIHPIRVP